jgi:peptidoglycan glycosyltransferase
LLLNLSWIQVLDADNIRQRQGNTRLLLEQHNRMRGPILVEGVPVASSARVAGDNVYQRSYTDGPLYASATGFYSLLYGATGIEQAENDVLSGSDPRLFVDRVQQLFAGRRQSGGAVGLTLSAAAQRAAFNAIAGHRGAVAAIDARTGAVLVLVSSPGFDPQVLAPNDPRLVRTAYDRLRSDPEQPLLDRVLEQRYSPGTVFAIVTAAAALSTDRFTADSMLPAPARYTVPGTHVTIANADDRPCSVSRRLPLAAALSSNCATAIAWLANAVGADAIRNTADQLGFNNDFAIPLHVEASTASSQQAAIMGVGGSTVQTTVLQLAMLAASVSNQGTTMRPYLVRDVRGPDLAVLEQTTPTEFGTPMSTQVAATLSRVLRAAATRTECIGCNEPGVHALMSATRRGAPTVMISFTGGVAVAVVVERSTNVSGDRALAGATSKAVLAALGPSA